MSAIGSILRTIFFSAYILSWFIGCAFVTFSVFETIHRNNNNKKSLPYQFWEIILYLSFLVFCCSGMIEGMSIGDMVSNIKNLW
jgi:uncharacterized membrane protein HdeD (DUF308 family)